MTTLKVARKEAIESYHKMLHEIRSQGGKVISTAISSIGTWVIEYRINDDETIQTECRIVRDYDQDR